MQTLTKITAKDIMRTDVATLRPEDTLESAIELFEELHISGAPVVDGSGELIGVLSASDIARFAREKGTARGGASEKLEQLDDELTEDEGRFEVNDYSEELLGRERVCDWMTAKVISARPDATLRDLCRVMSRESVHRVVIASGKQLAGLVTSFDVVRCVAEHG
ncbi:MAG: CBS domain-containing protein [Planctomycetes bacterium]|nr:CBS domain-containing protein [Planctomycetota bacterium]